MTWASRYPFLRAGTRSQLRFTTRRVLFITLAIICIFLLIYNFPISPKASKEPTFPLVELGLRACENWETKRITKAPNLVHYILLSPHPNPNLASLNLSLKHFISIHSAYLYFRPETIYIHTNIPLSVFTTAKESGNEWTQRILSIPSLKHHYISPPLQTSKGTPILTTKDRSQFLRIQILHEYGGIYLSPSSVPLRSISSLLNSGFANILSGTRGSELLYTNVMISAPRSALMEIYLKSAHEFYSSSSSNSFFTSLLSSLATRFSSIPQEVLILSPASFAPTSSSSSSKIDLFTPRFETVHGLAVLSYNEGENLTSCKDMLELMVKREISRMEEWEVSFSGAYVLGGFEGFDDEDWVDKGMRLKEGHKGAKKGNEWNGKLDLEYVLARQSVWSRAVYPAVEQAIQNGYIMQL